MKPLSVLLIVLFGLCGRHAFAQLQTGDILLVDLADEVIRVDVPNAGFDIFSAAQPFSTNPFADVHSVLWVPDHPQEVLVGGASQGANFANPALNSIFGFAQPQVATQTVAWSPLTLPVGNPAQMSLDNLGRVIVISQANWGPNYNGDFVGRIRRVDLQAGTVTELTPSGFFLPATPTAGVFDPWTDDIYIGTDNNEIYRWDHQSGVATLVTAIPALPPFNAPAVTGIALDPFSDELIVSIINDNRVIRMTPTGQITSSVQLPGFVNGLTIDQNGDVIAIYDFTVARIPQGGGAPVVLASAPGSIFNLFTGVTVVGGLTRRVCQPDLGGASPGGGTLMVCGGALESGKVADLGVTGLDPFASLVLVGNFSQGPFPLPFAGGSFIPDIASTPLTFFATADAQGRLFAQGIPGGNGPASFYLQGVAADPNNPTGFSLTNAVRMDLLP